MFRRKNDTTADLVKGAVAGLAATWAMGRVTTLLYEREDPVARRREDEARGGATAYETAVRKVAGLFGAKLPNERAQMLGNALHWALGVGGIMAYAVLRRRNRPIASANGLAFGTGFWAAVDETAVPALGLTPGPTAFPWQAHARGLAGHLAYGAVADGALRVLDRAA